MIDTVLTVVYCLIVLSVLVFIHEGGHYLSARMFGVRVTEFMLGLPGPKISFKTKNTRFGITCILLGGYARVCGMESGNMRPYIDDLLHELYSKGKVDAVAYAKAHKIDPMDAANALSELCDWGCAEDSRNKGEEWTFYANEVDGYKLGEPRKVPSKLALFKQEYYKQYRSLSFWKKSIVVLAGIFVNVLFAFIVFVILYSVVGVDLQYVDTGEITHVTLTPLQSINYGFNCVGAMVQAVLKLLNPVTMADTVSKSSSVVGIAVMSKSSADKGLFEFMQFMAIISISLGIMNLIPIPPLDGGRWMVEIIQKITGKNIPRKVVNGITIVGVILLVLLFVVVLNQDIQRLFTGIM